MYAYMYVQQETYYYIRLTAFYRTTWVSQHQKGKKNYGYHWYNDGGGSGISWRIYKSYAPCSRQITSPVPHHSVFKGRMPFLPPNQQCQNTEGIQQDRNVYYFVLLLFLCFSALMLLVGHKKEQLVCKKIE